MPPDQSDLSPEEFLVKLEAGEFDGNLASEIKKLPHENLQKVASILMERERYAKQRKNPSTHF